MLKTTNYKLNKPELADQYNIADFNFNADTIDTTLHNLQVEVTNDKQDLVDKDKAINKKVDNVINGTTKVEKAGIADALIPGAKIGNKDITTNDNIVTLEAINDKYVKDVSLNIDEIWEDGTYTGDGQEFTGLPTSKYIYFRLIVSHCWRAESKQRMQIYIPITQALEGYPICVRIGDFNTKKWGSWVSFGMILDKKEIATTESTVARAMKLQGLVDDDRETNTSPNDYLDSFTLAKLKTASALGLPTDEFYANVFGFNNYVDMSGAGSSEIATTKSGELFLRSSDNEGWRNWNKFVTSNEIYNLMKKPNLPLRSNLDNLTEAGCWWCSVNGNYENAPLGFNGFVIKVDWIAGHLVFRQTAYQHSNNKIAVRINNAGSWTTWQEIATTADISAEIKNRFTLNDLGDELTIDLS